MDANSDPWKTIPDQWRGKLASQLASGEELIAGFEFDLDCRLHYATGMVALTNRRFLTTNVENAGLPHTTTPSSLVETNGSATSWQSWAIADGMELGTVESGGVGTLELRDLESPPGILALHRSPQWDGQELRSLLDQPESAPGERRSCRSAADGVSQLRPGYHQRRSHLRRLRRQSAAADRVVTLSIAEIRPSPRRHGGVGIVAYHRRQCDRSDSAVLDGAPGGQRVESARTRRSGEHSSGLFLFGRLVWRRDRRLVLELGSSVRHRLGQRAHRRRFARRVHTSTCKACRSNFSAANAPAI